MDAETLYIVDASSLIELEHWRPHSKHPKVWQKLDGLIRQDLLISPVEVYDELRRYADSLAKWANRHRKKLFVRSSRQHVGIAKQIIHNYPELVDLNRPTAQADPFVIALAVHESKYTTLTQARAVVTQEKYTPHGRPRIPHVCAEYKLPYLTIHQLYVIQGWDF